MELYLPSSLYTFMACWLSQGQLFIYSKNSETLQNVYNIALVSLSGHHEIDKVKVTKYMWLSSHEVDKEAVPCWCNIDISFQVLLLLMWIDENVRMTSHFLPDFYHQ